MHLSIFFYQVGDKLYQVISKKRNFWNLYWWTKIEIQQPTNWEIETKIRKKRNLIFCSIVSTSWPMKDVRWRPPCFFYSYTPKDLYNSRSRKTAQLGTTKIPYDRQKRHRRLSTLTPAKVSQLHAGGKNTGMRELMLLLLGPHNIQFYIRGNIFVQNDTMHSDIFGFGSSRKSLRN